MVLRLFLAVLPVVIILYLFIYIIDKRQRENLLHLFIYIVLGGIAAIPAYLIESWYEKTIIQNDDWLQTILHSYIIIGFGEELLKYLPVCLVLIKSVEFDEWIDGVVYTICIGMGFALVENLIYAFDYDLITVVVRALTAVPAHAIFAIFMGFFISRYKFSKSRKFLVLGILFPFLLHGTYDFFIIQTGSDFIRIFAPLLLIVLIPVSIHLIRQLGLSDQ
jgi:RsiW-degrading membrane proteinase PrsW (M82 family)